MHVHLSMNMGASGNRIHISSNSCHQKLSHTKVMWKMSSRYNFIAIYLISLACLSYTWLHVTFLRERVKKKASPYCLHSFLVSRREWFLSELWTADNQHNFCRLRFGNLCHSLLSEENLHMQPWLWPGPLASKVWLFLTVLSCFCQKVWAQHTHQACPSWEQTEIPQPHPKYRLVRMKPRC